jgi:hypothetical protein
MMRENKGALARLALPVLGSKLCGVICRQTCAVSMLRKFLGGLQIQQQPAGLGLQRLLLCGVLLHAS